MQISDKLHLFYAGATSPAIPARGLAPWTLLRWGPKMNRSRWRVAIAFSPMLPAPESAFGTT